ncbi:hypothetical protein CTAYLR_005364 [Chrysophaeum taylorii]|uniref:Uncharacterized protein n=1 Tax=Chrysophaeum taylorii TaxID=2483200 RepID=A0AAD7XHB2_9STRA|nr:hypothetical protein CTAYLR_005364 [Chrysophaeum taylorii]
MRSLVGQDVMPLAAAAIFLVLAALADVAVPHFSSTALNAIVANGKGEQRSVAEPVVGLLVASTLAAIFTGLRGAAFWLAGSRVVSRLRRAMFENLLAQDLGYFDATSRGELTSRLSSDATKVADVVSFNLNILARQTIQAVGGVAYLFWLDARLATLAVSFMALAGVLTDVYGRFARATSRRTQDALARAAAVADESLENVRVVRALGAEDRVAADYARAVAAATALQRRHGLGYGASRVALGLARAGSTAAILACGELARRSGAITSETLVAFVFYSAFVNSAAFDVGDQWAKVEEALGAGAAAFDVATRTPTWTGANPPSALLSKCTELDSDGLLVLDRSRFPRATTCDPPEKTATTGRIDLESVTFSYPSRPDDLALDNVTISVPSGAKVALVGPSGSGKSTVVRLVLRQYETKEGRVSLDGIDIRDLDQRGLSRRLAYVEQEPRLFDGTVSDNVRFGLADDDPLAADDNVIDAARRAGVLEFTDRLPDGLETRVGASGAFLSGGQKARVAIARALLRRPAVIVLDEPTAALDSESERLVQHAIDATNSSKLVVAHRLSTIQSSDLIYCLRDGTVAEKGTHQQLLAIKGGLYASMVKKQNLSYANDDPSSPPPQSEQQQPQQDDDDNVPTFDEHHPDAQDAARSPLAGVGPSAH